MQNKRATCTLKVPIWTIKLYLHLLKDKKVSLKEILHHNNRTRDKNLPAGELTLAALGDDNKMTARLSVSQHLVHSHLEASEKFRGGDLGDGC